MHATFRKSLKSSFPDAGRMLGLGLAPLILLLFSGFRLANKTGLDVVKENMERYGVHSRVELIKSVTIDHRGNVTTRKILRMDQTGEGGTHAALLRFLEPEAVAGVSLLSILGKNNQSDQFLYMPALGEVRKIAGSGQKGYFMGTDFAFGDLLPENTNRFHYERETDDYIDDVQCYRVVARPVDSAVKATTGYVKRVLWITTKDLRLLRIDFFNREDQMLKTLTLSEFEAAAKGSDLELPKRAEMKHLVRKTASIFAVTRGAYDIALSPSYFTEDALRNWKPEYDTAIFSNLSN